MSRSTRFNRALTALLVSLPLGLSAADEKPATTPAQTAVAAPTVPVTPKQQQDTARDAVTELENGVKTIQDRINAATLQNDFVLLNCLNPKLTEIRGYHRAATDAKFDLDSAIKLENRDQAVFNYDKATLARTEGLRTVAAAKACVTQVGTGAGGGTRLVVENKNGDTPAVTPAQTTGSTANTRPPDASPDGG